MNLRKLLSLVRPVRLRQLRAMLSLAHVRREVERYTDMGLTVFEAAALVGAELDQLVDWARVGGLLGLPRARVAGLVAEALDGPLATLGILVAYRLAVRRGVEPAPEGSRPTVPEGDEGPKRTREELLKLAGAEPGRASG